MSLLRIPDPCFQVSDLRRQQKSREQKEGIAEVTRLRAGGPGGSAGDAKDKEERLNQLLQAGPGSAGASRGRGGDVGIGEKSKKRKAMVRRLTLLSLMAALHRTCTLVYCPPDSIVQRSPLWWEMCVCVWSTVWLGL